MGCTGGQKPGFLRKFCVVARRIGKNPVSLVWECDRNVINPITFDREIGNEIRRKCEIRGDDSRKYAGLGYGG